MKISTLLKTTATIIVILLILSGWGLFSLIGSMHKQTDALKMDKELEVLANQLQGASDYLTNEVRAYTQFGDKSHYNNYWKEVNETKTREMVVERLKQLNVPTELLDLVELAQQNSNNLILLEEQAMEAVANNDLALARLLVYGSDYQSGKDIIAKPLHEFNTQLEEWTAGKVIDSENSVTHRMTLLIIFMFLVGIAVIFTFVLLLIKIKPLGSLTELAAQLASGNLKMEALPVRSKDEVATLTESFNSMSKQLREVLLTVNDTSNNLTASSQELLAGTEQSNSALQQVSRAIEEVANDTNKQSVQIEESSLAIKEVLQGIHLIAESTSVVATSSEETTLKSKAGEESINKAIYQMKTIEDTVKETAHSVQALNERSKEIEEIITAITNISGQTNLLALNASIEAARAGEHGKGFAVVANEVKKLAEESSQSAQQITDIIKSIQQDTLSAVNQMSVVTQNVLTGVSIIENTGSSFAEILTSAGEVSEKIHEVSAVSEQIVASTNQIAASFNAVNVLAKNTTTQTYNVSALAEEQLATIEEIASSTELLTQLAQQLNNQLTKFQL